MLSMNDIRKCFINFFQSKGHEVVRSSSLIPRDDPSLLFTNAGMVQFKKIFQGLEKKDYTCATTSQKCLRVGGKHNDLENVGRTARHHTFFEMLGNFSFGNYFKKDAICYAWEFLTEELKLPKERLYATVYLDDDEAFDLWIKYTDIPANRIFRMGEKDNFWTMGDTGPCGPCSEILIDQGEHMSCGSNCGIGKCDCDRFLEIWNLVFMQFNQTNTGTREKLANPCIDTGMGLERITAVCQGVYSNYDSDLFRKIIDYSCSLARVTYSESAPDTNETDTALRVIADHSRSIAFMIADGIMPSNEGRGYVLRRLIRRAYRFGRSIGMPSTFIFLTASNIVDLMGESFPELISNKEFMIRLIKEEEERFEKTLDKGLHLLENEIQLAKKAKNNKLSGDVTFKLYDTYGFPIDIVNDVCAKQSMSVDEKSFHVFMAEQKQRAKASWKGSGEIDITTRFTALLEDGLSTTFIGYTQLKTESRIIALLSSEGEAIDVLKKNEKGYLVTGLTPFYGASGGQESDTGIVESDLGKAEVTDVIKVSDKLTVQAITVTKGEILLDASVCLYVTTENRLATARNHTCTHLLQAALQAVVGSHVHQAGSLVTKDRLRFDFTHMSALTSEEITEIEKHVNDAIMKDISVQVREMDYESAVASGATALFGEKYSNVVRVVSVEGVSSELCGGTHLERTGQAGTFIILSESGVAAGVRRIEAITGWNTLDYFNEQRKELVETHRLLKSKSGKLPERIEALQTELREAKKNFEKISSQVASGQGKALINSIETVNETPVLMANVSATSVKILREIMDDLRSKISSGVICLASIIDSKPTLLVFVSKNLHGKFTAPSIIKEIAIAIQGSGGGRPDMAQAGGTKPEGIEESFVLLKNMIMKSHQ